MWLNLNNQHLWSKRGLRLFRSSLCYFPSILWWWHSRQRLVLWRLWQDSASVSRLNHKRCSFQTISAPGSEIYGHVYHQLASIIITGLLGVTEMHSQIKLDCLYRPGWGASSASRRSYNLLLWLPAWGYITPTAHLPLAATLDHRKAVCPKGTQESEWAASAVAGQQTEGSGARMPGWEYERQGVHLFTGELPGAIGRLTETLQGSNRNTSAKPSAAWNSAKPCDRPRTGLCASWMNRSQAKMSRFFKDKRVESKWSQLTGILLGCCSRISRTSSTLCSAGKKNKAQTRSLFFPPHQRNTDVWLHWCIKTSTWVKCIVNS